MLVGEISCFLRISASFFTWKERERERERRGRERGERERKEGFMSHMYYLYVTLFAYFQI
jgi:hypothetical protein